jgi:hypothetical protein
MLSSVKLSLMVSHIMVCEYNMIMIRSGVVHDRISYTLHGNSVGPRESAMPFPVSCNGAFPISL